MISPEKIMFGAMGIRETAGLNPIATFLLIAAGRDYVRKNHTIFEGVHFPELGPALVVGNHFREGDSYKVTYDCSTYAHRIVRAVIRRSLVDKKARESAEFLESIGERAEPLKYNPVSAFVLRGSGTIPYSRGETDLSTIRTSRKTLNDGEILGIFLRLTRDENCGLTGLQLGAAGIALRHPDVPVYLCAFSGPPYGPDKMTTIDPNEFMLKQSRRELDVVETSIMMADMIAERLPAVPQRNWWANREAEIARLRGLQRVRS